MATLLLFVILQICDVLTTVLFLRHGVAEANPIVRSALTISSHPAFPLIALKLVACGVAFLGWRSGRRRLLRHVNTFFALCVAWNLVTLAV